MPGAAGSRGSPGRRAGVPDAGSCRTSGSAGERQPAAGVPRVAQAVASFFIDRPIFAWVIAIVIMLAGALAIRTLPVAQYPDIAPPQRRRSTPPTPARRAETVEDSVTQVIEQQLTGIDGLLYMSRPSTSTAQARITLTFAPGTDPDIAQVQVQNKLQQATPRLPQEVQQQGVTRHQVGSNFLMIVGFVSTRRHADATSTSPTTSPPASRTRSARVDGVGDVQVFGSQLRDAHLARPGQAAAVSR